MRTSRNHYEVLGLPKDATLVQIKRRYRELARKYHPDVARDKELAHRLFIQISEAYDTLSDPDRRKAYDLGLQSDYISTTGRSTTAGSSSPPASTVIEFLRNAQLAFVKKQYSETLTNCKSALKVEPRNAHAYAIMGDVYRMQGKTEHAIDAFSMALQFNPKDQESQRKLMKLIEKQSRTREARRQVREHRERNVKINMVWWGIAFFLIMLIGVYPGEPVPVLQKYTPMEHWSWNLVGLMGGAALIVGVLLSINGLVRHPDEELTFDTSDGWLMVPTGFILLIGSGFLFLGAALFYLIIGLIQWNISKSIMIAFAATVGVVLLSALNYPQGRMEVVMFGGNVSFISLMIGWYIGSMFKPFDEA